MYLVPLCYLQGWHNFQINLFWCSIFVLYMIDKLEETVHDNNAETLDCKSLGIKHLKSYVSTYNRSITCSVLISSNLN